MFVLSTSAEKKFVMFKNCILLKCMKWNGIWPQQKTDHPKMCNNKTHQNQISNYVRAIFFFTWTILCFDWDTLILHLPKNFTNFIFAEIIQRNWIQIKNDSIRFPFLFIMEQVNEMRDTWTAGLTHRDRNNRQVVDVGCSLTFSLFVGWIFCHIN